MTRFTEFVTEEWKYIKLEASLLSMNITAAVIPLITVLFSGHINQAHLNGVGLAVTIYNLFVVSASRGFSFVFFTYGAQVRGSAEPKELGTVLVQCLLQGGLMQLMLFGPFLNIVYIIDLLPKTGLHSAVNQGGDTSVDDFRDIAVQYFRLVMLTEYPRYIFSTIIKYFAIQGQKKFMYIVNVANLAAHILFNYLLVSVFGLGVTGLALATILSVIVGLAVSVAICIVNIKNGTFLWNGFSMKVLIGWKPMMKLGVSGAIKVFVNLLLYEITTFCSRFASITTLSVVVILLRISHIMSSFSLAIAGAAATLIGKALAEGSLSKVMLYMKLTLFNTLLEAVSIALVSYFLRDYLVRIFIHDQEVIDLFTRSLWIVCLGLVINHIQVVSNNGVLVAFGAQKFIAWAMSIATFVAGLPFVLMTIFLTDLKVIGISLGWSLVDIITLIAAMVKLLRMDIDNEIEKTCRRVAEYTDGSTTKVRAGDGFENSIDSVVEDGVKQETGPEEPLPENVLGSKDQDLLGNQPSEMSGDRRSSDIGESNCEASCSGKALAAVVRKDKEIEKTCPRVAKSHDNSKARLMTGSEFENRNYKSTDDHTSGLSTGNGTINLIHGTEENKMRTGPKKARPGENLGIKEGQLDKKYKPGEISKETRSVDNGELNGEARKVVIAFLVSAVISAALAGVSFLRD